ncbi:hypothetical protein DFP72DRAFT_802676 [Ephemerocybe angulata]|uniref:Peroxisome membrane anchor protein Pex14p N-terminal domain-containing protein n=1 Tax=Ephemerocybe angulata TaxID=980116 RepID=A0A8H6MDS1_9AGAR|nr:hypothetical protein DFP72DRAFT_802676 [Tulosesus angulatus]
MDGPSVAAESSTSTPAPVASSSQVQQTVAASSSTVGGRGDLISRARTFLHSPQIQGQDVSQQRRFLAEKGLSEGEINGLLSEPSGIRVPAIPPRSYPQPPPSNLPTLLLGLVRLFSWIGMGSAAVIFLYYRILLPRIIKTTQARKALRTYHLTLMGKLSESISSLKEAQKEDFASLPRADPYVESPIFARCKSVSAVLKTLDEKEPDYASLPPITLLRCAIADLSRGKSEEDANPSAEEILRLLEGRIPWLQTEEGYTLKLSVYDTLISCPLFVEEKSSTETSQDNAPLSTWVYVRPPPREPSPLVTSLADLSTAMPPADERRASPFGHVIEALSEFTGYISSQVYVPYHPPSSGGLGMSSGSGPAEEQLKREIRALKGLVLSRCVSVY